MSRHAIFTRKIMLFLFFLILGFLMMGCHTQDDFLNELSSTHQGQYIKELSIDKSAYLPGEEVQISVSLENPDDEVMTLTIDIRLTQLSNLISEFTQSVTLGVGTEWTTLTLQPPSEDYQGYALEIYLYHKDQLIDYKMTGIDVSSTWNVFPRYAAISHYDLSDSSQAETVLNWFKDYHINGLMYYDVIDRHDQMLAGDTLQPSETWNTINQSLASKSILDFYIDLGHDYQMNSFVYNLLFGGYEDYLTQGISEEWGIYTDSQHLFQDYHPLPSSWETSKLYLFNPGNVYWQDYYINAMADLLEVYSFDGIQADSLGSRGIRYDYEGNIIYLDNLYSNFLNRLSQELDTQVIFNPVNGYGLDEILTEDFNDIIYMEIWDGNYYTLQKTLFDIYLSTGGAIGTVLAAYMNYGNETGYFNTPSVKYTNAVIIASGGSHLELVDTGMLSKEYYPGTMLLMSDDLKSSLLNSYSFQVAYENVLRGPGLTLSNNRTVLQGYEVSKTGEQGKIWSFARLKGENQEVLHFINLLNVTSTDWEDSPRTKELPQIQTNLLVKHYYSFQPSQVTIASPDSFEGISFEIPFTLGTDSYGEYIEFEVPFLEYYTMVVIG